MSKSRSSRKGRRERLARQKQRQRLRLWILIGIVGAAFVALVLFRVFEPGIEGVVEYPGQSREHDVAATFDETAGLPPTGGTHHPSWQNCGIYDTPVETTLAVHAMEHGAVWLTYNGDLPPAQIETLRQLVSGDGWVLMSPYPGLSSDVVVSAWEKQLVANSPDDARIEAFVSRYRAQGPEQGATCTNGVGTPIG